MEDMTDRDFYIGRMQFRELVVMSGVVLTLIGLGVCVFFLITSNPFFGIGVGVFMVLGIAVVVQGSSWVLDGREVDFPYIAITVNEKRVLKLTRCGYNATPYFHGSLRSKYRKPVTEVFKEKVKPLVEATSVRFLDGDNVFGYKNPEYFRRVATLIDGTEVDGKAMKARVVEI